MIFAIFNYLLLLLPFFFEFHYLGQTIKNSYHYNYVPKS